MVIPIFNDWPHINTKNLSAQKIAFSIGRTSLTAGFFMSVLKRVGQVKEQNLQSVSGSVGELSASKLSVQVNDRGVAAGCGSVGSVGFAEDPIMQFFKYEHLPAHLQGVSKAVAGLAKLMDEQLPHGAEKSVGLRKLLEAKDCFVRASLNMPNTVDAGRVSDGYHTFNELYLHRMHLFAVVCTQNQTHAWKSKLHHDGTMYDGYFIVGVETPMGQFSYHYELTHWPHFHKIAEVERAPKWDGHTADDVVKLHSLLEIAP